MDWDIFLCSFYLRNLHGRLYLRICQRNLIEGERTSLKETKCTLTINLSVLFLAQAFLYRLFKQSNLCTFLHHKLSSSNFQSSDVIADFYRDFLWSQLRIWACVIGLFGHFCGYCKNLFSKVYFFFFDCGFLLTSVVVKQILH